MPARWQLPQLFSPMMGVPVKRDEHLKDFVEWDVRNWSCALEFWLKHTTQTIAECSALEIGARNGGLSLWLAQRGAEVLCSDKGGANERAVALHEASGVSRQIRYASIDACNIPYTNAFDIILFKSVLGSVGSSHDGKSAQAEVLNQSYKALKENGELFFAENLVASPIHSFFRRRFVPWASGWRYVSLPEIREYLAPFSHVECRTAGFVGAFGRSEAQRTALGALDTWMFDRVVPERWKYIVMGVARK